MSNVQDASSLRPLVASVVAEVLESLRREERADPLQRIAYSEPEAASILGVRPHVLRDARLRGEVISTRVGGRIAYEPDALKKYLANNRQM